MNKLKKIPLTCPSFDKRELQALKKVLDSGWVTQGPMVSKFEENFASLHKVKYAYAVNSCTSALHLATLAIGLRPGDEAIVPAFTWVTSANCIEYTGAKAVFCDIDLNTYIIDTNQIEKKITKRTKAIVVVHLFGLSAQMDKIIKIAKKHNLKIIEDAACAVGCTYKGTPVGGIGDIGCFSFHPRKIITTGEGGMVITNNRKFADVINSLRNHGCSGTGKPGPNPKAKPYAMSGVDKLGYNFRMSDIQGAIGLTQLKKLAHLLKERAGWASKYNHALSSEKSLSLPNIPPNCAHTYQSYVVRISDGDVKRRNKIMDVLAGNGIWSRPGTHAVHHLEYYRKKYALSSSDFPNSTNAEDTTITLPIFPKMNHHDFQYILKTLKNALHQN